MLCVFSWTFVQAQDPQYSQFYAAPLYLNPAFAGSAMAPRVNFNHRNQWPSLSANFVTSSLSADMYFDKYNSGVGAMRHGYKGAFEMSATLDYLFAYDATTNCVSDFMYEGVAEAYIFNPDVQNFIKSSNPWALRDMSERLLEANQRGMWQNVAADMLDRLKAIANEAEGTIESQT